MSKEKLSEEIVMKQYASILRYCLYKLEQDMQAAEECTQEVFLLFWQKKDDLNLELNIRGWLYATADRICRDYCKKEAKRSSMIETNLGDLENIAVEFDVLDSPSVFDALSDEEYQLLTAYYAESYGQRRHLAESLGLTTVQLTRRVHSILEKIRKRIKNGKPE